MSKETTQAEPPAPVPHLIVKPLVWSRWPEDGTVQFEGLGQKRRYMARALTPFGAIFLMSRNRVEFTLVASGSQKTDEGTFGCAEDAKAAAQADYARRILSALASEGQAE